MWGRDRKPGTQLLYRDNRLVLTRKILSHGLIHCLGDFLSVDLHYFLYFYFTGTAVETTHYFFFSTFTFEPGHFLLLLKTKVEFVLWPTHFVISPEAQKEPSVQHIQEHRSTNYCHLVDDKLNHRFVA